MFYKRNSLSAVFIFIFVCALMLLRMVKTVAPSSMMAELQSIFKVDIAHVGVVALYYFVPVLLLQIPVGLLVDRFDLRTLVNLSCICYALGAFLLGNAEQIGAVYLANILIGVASSLPWVLAVTVAARWFTTRRIASMIGVIQFAGALGALVGVLPFVALFNAIGWRQIHFVIGVTFLLLGMIGVIFMRSRPYDAPRLAPSNRLTVAQSLREVFCNPQTYTLMAYTFFNWFPIAFFGTWWGIPYLMNRYGMSNVEAGRVVGFIWLGIMIASPLLGLLSDFTRRRLPYLQLPCILGIVASLAILYIPLMPTWLLFICITCIGVAASGKSIATALVYDHNRTSNTGLVVGVNSVGFFLAIVVLLPFVGDLIVTDPKHAVKLTSAVTDRANWILAVIPFSFLVALCISIFFAKETHCKGTFKPNQ